MPPEGRKSLKFTTKKKIINKCEIVAVALYATRRGVQRRGYRREQNMIFFMQKSKFMKLAQNDLERRAWIKHMCFILRF